MSKDICESCGLPKGELCVCEDDEVFEDREEVTLSYETRSGYEVTLVKDVSDAEQLVTEIQSKLGCGGTSKDNTVELQGDHRQKVKEELEERGYVVNVEI